MDPAFPSLTASRSPSPKGRTIFIILYTTKAHKLFPLYICFHAHGIAVGAKDDGPVFVRATDGVDFAKDKADAFLDKARAALPENLPPDIREAFLMVVDFIGDRDF